MDCKNPCCFTVWGKYNERKVRKVHLQRDVVEEVGVVVSYVSARLTRKNDCSLKERKGGQSALSPSHPNSEILMNVFRVFFLDSLIQLREEVWHQIHILEF